MGWYVHISVAFNVHNEKALQRLAVKHHAPELRREMTDEAVAFLLEVAAGRCVGWGRKGTVCTWGCIGNYARGEDFVKCLIPFWEDLYREWPDTADDDMAEVVLSSRRIVVFEEQEQSEQAIAFVVENDEGRITVTRHELPFAWGQ